MKKYIDKFLPTRGFTLIELLVIIGVIGLLAAALVIIINPEEQFKKARDAKRKSDLAEIQRGLEIYYNDHGQYPPFMDYRIYEDLNKDGEFSASADDAVNAANPERHDWGTPWEPYFAKLPEDPHYAGFETPTYKYIALPITTFDPVNDPWNSIPGHLCNETTTKCIGYVIYAHLEREDRDPDHCPLIMGSGGFMKCPGSPNHGCGTEVVPCNYMVTSPNLKVPSTLDTYTD